MLWRAMRQCWFATALCALVLLASGGWAHAQVESREGIALQNQILQLRHDLESLRGQLAAGGGAALVNPYPEAPSPAGNLTARLLTRVAALEDHVRTLTGRVDELANQVKRQNDLLTKQIGDLSFRLQNLEGGSHRAPPTPRAEATRPERQAEAASAPPQPRSAPPESLGTLPLLPPPEPSAPSYPAETANGALPLLPPQPAERRAAPGTATAGGALPLLPPSAASPAEPPRAPAPPRNTAEARLRDIRAALGRRDYAGAEAGAREVLGGGTRRHAAEAHYLLARALSGQRNYAKAAVSYDEAYKNSPTGPYAEVALLGMASSLANLGAKPAACAALDKLKAEFLTERASVRQAAAALRQREGCRP